MLLVTVHGDAGSAGEAAASSAITLYEAKVPNTANAIND